jgi:hypothetical protein
MEEIMDNIDHAGYHTFGYAFACQRVVGISLFLTQQFVCPTATMGH